MRFRHFATILAVVVVMLGILVPSYALRSVDWLRDWVRIVTTPDNYSFFARDPVPRFRLGFLAPPFMLRKTALPPGLYSDQEGYEVFKAWLKENQDSGPAMVQRESTTLIDPIDRCFPRELREDLADALADFAVNNTRAYYFNLRAMGNVRSVNARWRGAPEASFSAVGFNHDKTVAILYATYWCGGRCGRGTYFILDKRNGHWGNVHQIGRCGWTL